MSTPISPVIPPTKDELPKELYRLTTTLSEAMQSAATKKARELNFDFAAGRLSLQETLGNLSRDRDTIIDAVEKNTLVQLPLKVQYALYGQTHRISETLTALVNGTDAVLALEDAVEDLTATVWQYNLHNLSREVLGYQTKMNQLKAQEVLIQRVHNEALGFEVSTTRANELLAKIEEIVASATERAKAVQASVDQSTALLETVKENEQTVAGLVIRTQQSDSATALHEAAAKTASADIQVIAGKLPALHTEIDAAKTTVDDLSAKATNLLSTIQTTSDESLAHFRSGYEKLVETTTGQVAELETSVGSLVTRTAQQLETLQSDQQSHFTAEIKKATNVLDQTVDTLRVDGKETLSVATEKFNVYVAEAETQQRQLVAHLEELEGKIRDSIRRATGYGLFHSFQTRQLELVNSKKTWAIALLCVVATSVGLSGWLIWNLTNGGVTSGPAFYLKLSVSLPLIYAITFCSLQYSRERRLEEEYAFKSNISISLEPYQRLVGELVKADNPEELAKYTAFIIESVSRVFTSPTGPIFDDQSKDSTATVGSLLKAVEDILKVLLKR